MVYIIENEPLALHTSWRIGGPARFYGEVSTAEDLREAMVWGYERDIPVFILGSGTNVLALDEGFAGLVIRYCAREWHIKDGGSGVGILYADAGVSIGRLAWMIGAQGWGNMTWAAGLPGSVGGAMYGNAGCYGGDVASVLHSAKVFVNHTIQEWTVDQMSYAYRESILKSWTNNVKPHEQRWNHPPILLGGEFHLVRQDDSELLQMMKQIAQQRKAKTPVGKSSGSVFKNPFGTMSAGQLIDQAGLKGTRIGGAEISAVHANYIINVGGARSEDVFRLIELVQKSVFRQFGVLLELEVQTVDNARHRVQSILYP